MNEDLENRADMNTGKKWSQMDLLDLANCIKLNDPVEPRVMRCMNRRGRPRRDQYGFDIAYDE